MPSPSDLISQALTKQTSVAAAAESKQAALGAQDFYNIAAGQSSSNAGMASASQVEQDVRTKNLDQLFGTYGADAWKLIDGIATGSREFQRDAYAQRQPGQGVADAVVGVGQGLVNSVGGIAALGAGLVDDEAGAVASSLLGSFNEAFEGLQSPALAARRRANAARNAMAFRDNKQLFEEDKATNGEFMASLKRIGRDASDAVSNALDDSTILSDGVTQGVGSLLAAGPVGRAIGAAGRAVVPQTRQNALNVAAALNPTLVNRAAAGAVNLGERAAIPLAIGAMEGGGAFAETNRAVMDMTHDELMQGSEDYRSLISQGIPEQEAKSQIANRSALTAAGIQAPIAVATGTLVSRFEGSPLTAGSLRGVASNILRETAEEGIQSATGQTAQNVGQRAYANSDLTLSEGVGEQAGLGALYGAGTAGALQTPTAAKQLVKASGKVALAGVGAIGASLDKRLARLQEKNEAASPVGDVQMQAAATELNAASETAMEAVQTQVESMQAEPEQKIEANDLAARIVESTRIDPANIAEYPEDFQVVFQDNPDRVTALNRLSKIFQGAKKADDTYSANVSLAMLYDLLEPIRDLQNTENELLNKLTGPAADAMKAYVKLIANIDNTTSLRQALKNVEDHAKSLQPVEEAQIETAEGQAQIIAAIAVAALAPEKGNLAANEMILKHAAEGKLQLSPKRFAALKVSTAILKAQVQQAQLLAQQGQESKVDIVGNEVMSDTKDASNNDAKSAWQHTQGVVQMMRAGRMGDAADLLQKFELFTQHMQNKLEAVNASYEGDAAPVKHQAIDTKKNKWYESKPYVIYPGKDGSIRFAQRVGNEAMLMTEVYNGLTEAFPELGAQKLPIPSLLPQLQGKASEIALANRLNQQAQRRAAQVQEQPQQVEPTQEEQTGDRMVREEEALEEAAQEREAIQAEQPVAQEPVQEQASEPTSEVVQETSDDRKAIAQELANTIEAGDTIVASDGDRIKVVRVMRGRDGNVRAIFPEPIQGEPDSGQAIDLAGINALLAPQYFQDAEGNRQLDAGGTIEKPTATAFRSLYPNLVSHVQNMFEKAFKVPTEPTTNIVGTGSPLAHVRNMLSSLGSLSSREMTQETLQSYRSLLGDYAEGLKDTMNDRLQNFLRQKNNSVLNAFKEGKEVNRWFAGKVLNLTEPNGDTYTYNQKLQEAGVLAAIDWSLNAASSESIMDESDIESIAGVGVENLSPDDITALSQGFSVEQVKRALASKIVRYWGLRPDRSVDKAYSDGVAEALASELMVAMMSTGLLNRAEVQLNQDQHGIDKTVYRYTITRNTDEDLRKFPDAIEQAVMIEPEERRYFGDAIPPVPQAQLNNPDVATTAAEREAVKNESATPFYADTHMINFIGSLGQEGVLSLFGSAISDNMNAQHRRSAEGQNRAFASAYLELFDTLADMGNRGDIATMPVRYAYGVTRVGRMQMLGKYNPQANKLMREAFLPTWSTLDMSKPNSAFGLATAQAFGIKVHNIGVDASVREAQAKMVALAPSVAVVENWLARTNMDRFTETTHQFTPAELSTIRRNFKEAGVDMTMHSLHALVENVRLQRTEDKSAFRTSLYLEADGVTNGPINAMMLFTPGQFTEKWMINTARGGVAYGPAQSMADIRANKETSADLYEVSTNAAREMLHAQEDLYDGETAGMADALKTVMSLLDPNVIYEEGELQLKRGIAKNPLTITLYGSGAAGIAGKLAKGLTETIYERLTAVAQSPENPAEAFFPNDPLAQDKYERLTDALELLSRWQVKRGKVDGKTVFYIEDGKAPAVNMNDPVKFKFDKAQMKNLNTNMLELFVKPMREGIEQTVGEELMGAVKVMRQASQAQSIMLSNMFDMRVREALAQKEAIAEALDWRKGDFLSQNELDNIMKSLLDLFPLVRTQTQSFLLAKTHVSEQAKMSYSRALTGSGNEFGSLETSPNYYAPADASVAAIPFMTIGMGDGRMMQILAQQNLPGTMKIFDGMNMPLDKIDEYSIAANKAVHASWQGNPLRAVLESNTGFIRKGLSTLTDADLASMMYDGDKPKALLTSLFSMKELKDSKITPAGVRSRITMLQNVLTNLSNSVQARHEVLVETAMSVDQMAAAAQPYASSTQQFDAVPDRADVLADLNARYEVKLREIKKRTPARTEIDLVSQEEMDRIRAARKVPVVEASIEPDAQVEVLTNYGLEKLVRSLGLNQEQKKIYSEITRSLAAKGYKVVVGSKAEIAKFDGTSFGADDNGMTNVGTKTIYLADPTAEVLVHEFIHAASFEQVLSHYEGRSTPELADAMKRLEILKDEFMSIDSESIGMQNARAAIQSAEADLTSSDSISKAKAMNEFMAWALTNQEITDLLSKTEAPVLVRIAKAVLQAIKQLLWGKQRAAKLDDSFLSSLRFNTAVVIRSGKPLSAQMQDINLAHNTVFGSSDRLKNVRDAFATQVVDHLKTPTSYAQSSQQNAGAMAQAMAVTLMQAVQAAGFRMTRQEASTFRLITHTLATTAEIDAPALAQAQALYTHVVKNLSVEDFMADPNSLDPAMRAEAQSKFDVLVGVRARKADAQGRSTMLPTFLALATVNDEFRAVLAKMPVPKNMAKGDGTLDTALEIQASKAMDSMIRKVSGQGNAKNVQQAIDNLQQQIQDTVADDQQWFDTVGNKVADVTDKINQRLIDGLQKLSNKSYDLGNNLSQSNNRYTRFSGSILRVLSGLGTDENANRVAESVVVLMNRANVIQPLREFLGDLIGRTENNADVYDMIKTTRATVQQMRQNFREEVPRTMASKFSRELTSLEQDMLYRGLAKTDISVLGSKAFDMLDAQNRASEIMRLEGELQTANKADWIDLQRKAKQLATFMNTGVAGNNLLRNAHAVSNLWGETKTKRFTPANVNAMDRLITLYALDGLSQDDLNSLSSLVQSERDGMQFSLAYLMGQRKTEMQAATDGRALANHYKGYVPYENQAGVSLTVGEASEHSGLMERSFVLKGAYQGSSIDKWTKSKNYYFSPVSPRAGFNQGILQNVRHTAGGVDQVTGFTMGMVAGRLVDPRLVSDLAKNLSNEGPTSEPLLPVYDQEGNIVAFERSIDPAQMKLVQQPQHFMQQVGVWRGRQVEEVFSVEVNGQLIEKLRDMHNTDISNKDARSQYVDLFNDPNLDPVTKDAVRLIPRQVRERIGDEFWVRKDMLNDVIGYRSATVGDAWTGNTRWNQETQDTVKKLALNAFRNDAYRYLVNSEKMIQNFIGEARTLIVVKSVVVPFVNFMSNIFQLISRGVPVVQIARSMPNKLVEIEQYTKSRLRQVQLEAEIRGTTDPVLERKLRAESRTIQDAHKRLSIWPLIEAGEFSSVADVNVTHEEVELTSGKLASYIEAQVDKMPDGLRTMGRYGLITRDTALFQGLQKSVQYGDFLAKAVLFDNLTKKKGMTAEQALARITEEFVNYDRLVGRTRSYLESIGLMWFYNFKIRSTKVALSMIRNNPLQTLMVGLSPIPDWFGDIGTPVDDNILTKGVEGTLGYSMGPAMGLRAPTLNPWFNLTN